MGWQMAEMDGFEGTRAIRRREKDTGQHIPIVALTANVMKADQAKCWESGMDDHIGKPLKKEKLVEAIERWCPDPEQKRKASQQAAGASEGALGGFQLRRMIDDVAMPLRAAAMEKGIELNVRVSKDVPNKLLGDRALIARLLTSLICQSVEWTAQGKVNLEVSKEGESESRVRLRFRVADSGGGLSAGQLEKLLNENSKYQATLGGNGIEGSSTPAEGSAFWFEAELERASRLTIEGAPHKGPEVRGGNGHGLEALQPTRGQSETD